MLRALFFIVIGYLLGSVLFARVFLRLAGKEALLADSSDGNPGTANAYKYGGFLCGTFTLLMDLLKGFVPVYLYIHLMPSPVSPILSAFVIAAPVIGHVFPIYYRFHGGKGIAVSFACLAGLFPDLNAFAALAFFFILYSVVVRVTPHYYRTMITYLSLIPALALGSWLPFVKGGTIIIVITVLLRLRLSREETDNPAVTLFGHTHTFVRYRRRA